MLHVSIRSGSECWFQPFEGCRQGVKWEHAVCMFCAIEVAGLQSRNWGDILPNMTVETQESPRNRFASYCEELLR